MNSITPTRWTDEEDAFLRCPIPATYLCAGALRHKSIGAVRWRRRHLGIYFVMGRSRAFVSLSGGPQYKLKHQLDDFPGMDWSLKLNEIQATLGVGINVAHRLRAEAATAKPTRRGRRGFNANDFPDIDWSKSDLALEKLHKISRRVIARMRRETHTGLTTGVL